MDDFNNLRMMVHQLVHTDFAYQCDFHISIDGFEDSLDMYVKDVSYGLLEIQTDDEQYGALTYTWPTSQNVQRISMTVRDDYRGTVVNVLKEWAQQVVHPDGTVGLPYGGGGYVKRAQIFDQAADGKERFVCSCEVYPTQCGEISRSRDSCEFVEMPVTLVQFAAGIEEGGGLMSLAGAGGNLLTALGEPLEKIRSAASTAKEYLSQGARIVRNGVSLYNDARRIYQQGKQMVKDATSSPQGAASTIQRIINL